MRWIAMLALLAFGVHAEESKTEIVNDKQFHEALQKIAQTYQSFGHADNGALWAPTDCKSPVEQKEPIVRISSSGDAETHGGKLYYLFAKDRPKYLLRHSEPSVVGQVLVKEAWKPKETTGPTQSSQYTAAKGGKFYQPDTKSALFIMLKLDPKTAGTDNGWVYGTVTPDGKEVTSAGRVASCMGCHQDAKVDRLFGLSLSK